jgi:hypothetical protein
VFSAVVGALLLYLSLQLLCYCVVLLLLVVVVVTVALLSACIVPYADGMSGAPARAALALYGLAKIVTDLHKEIPHTVRSRYSGAVRRCSRAWCGACFSRAFRPFLSHLSPAAVPG